MSKAKIWYENYEELSASVKDKRSEFSARCKILGASVAKVFNEVRVELIARAVKESNWQEGLKLNQPRTQELAYEAFEDYSGVKGPHLDMDYYIGKQRQIVRRLKRESASAEEIGAYNLSLAYYVVPLICNELATRQTASLAYALRGAKKHLDKIPRKSSKKGMSKIEKGFKVIEELEKSRISIDYPMTPRIKTEGEYFSALLNGDFSSLVNPMNIEYINFLHKLILRGLYPTRMCGRFRRSSVYVGLETVYFATPSLVPGLMREFCKSFPPIIPGIQKYDPILKAAEVSYKFVAIHPYLDGNGRVSRVIMNLILWGGEHPPVYLKAHKKGRRKYAQALKRANRGQIKPLGCLIAGSLLDIYEKLLESINP